MPRGEQCSRDLDHALHVVRGAWECVGCQNPHALLVSKKLIGEPLRDFGRSQPSAERLGNDLVLTAINKLLAHMADVGDVLDVPYAAAKSQQQPFE